ncbi:hypothetical protein QR685DRAFT_57310 [Neurospora intermedia]|uniref:Uncharacterized protein n=1 Tax=Neurospora intermedia TaxID=5142 RepID=A0ABR3DSR9_NEUIN
MFIFCSPSRLPFQETPLTLPRQLDLPVSYLSDKVGDDLQHTVDMFTNPSVSVLCQCRLSAGAGVLYYLHQLSNRYSRPGRAKRHSNSLGFQSDNGRLVGR